MIRAFIEGSCSLVAIALFCGMIAVWAALASGA